MEEKMGGNVKEWEFDYRRMMREKGRKDAAVVATVSKCLILRRKLHNDYSSCFPLLIIPPDKDSNVFSFAPMNRRQQCTRLRPLMMEGGCTDVQICLKTEKKQ